MTKYIKTEWSNDVAPPINADNLNKIEKGINAGVGYSSAHEIRALGVPSSVFSVVLTGSQSGRFVWDATSTESEDGANGAAGTVIQVAGHSGAGRYVRDKSSTAYMSWFGDPDVGFNYADSLIKAMKAGDRAVIDKDGYMFTFTDIDDAKYFLSNIYRVDALFPVTISLPEMDETISTIELGSEYGGNLTVEGFSTAFQSLSSAVINSESAGDHSITFTVSNGGEFTSGGMCFIKSVTGTGNLGVLEGVWPITAVVGNQVTVKNTLRQSEMPVFIVTSGSIAPAKTVLRFEGQNGIDCINFKPCGTWQSMALVGDGVGLGDIAGVRIIGGHIALAVSTAKPFGVYGFKEHGIYGLENAKIQCFDSFSSGNNQTGYYFLDGSLGQATRIISTGNDNQGIILANNSQVACSQANSSGNGQRGIQSSSGSFVIANTATFYNNGDSGVRADEGGELDLQGSIVSGSTSYGTRVNAGKVHGTIAYGPNGAANEFVENNGEINTATKKVFAVGDGAGVTAHAFANNLVIDTDSTNGGGISVLTKEAEYGAIYFGNDTDNDEASIRYRGTSNAMDFYTDGARSFSMSSSRSFLPASDNTQSVGSSSLRLSNIYAGTGTINTSDDRLKDYLDISEAEQGCAKELKGLMLKYRFKDSIREKGNKARIHFGTSAQSVIEVFKNHGLDANEYSLLCYDKWEAVNDEIINHPPSLSDDGEVIKEARTELIKGHPAGDRYGIRYEELLCFIVSAM